MMPTYLGLKKVIAKNTMPNITSMYDGWRLTNDFILSILLIQLMLKQTT